MANLLTGKLKPTWVPFMDMGDHVIIINAEKVKLTGRKLTKRCITDTADTQVA